MTTIIKTKDFRKDASATLIEAIEEVIAQKGTCIISLPGGKTPKPIYEEFAKSNLPWEKVFFFFGDEREHPMDHPDNNYNLTNINFFSKVPLPKEHIFRIETELGAEKASEKYAQTLTEFAQKHGMKEFAFDILAIGLGADGHTAGLFPGTQALIVTDKLVTPNDVPNTVRRITLTYPVLNRSAKVFFLVNDTTKQGRIDDILSGKSTVPAAGITGATGDVTWIIGDGVTER